MTVGFVALGIYASPAYAQTKVGVVTSLIGTATVERALTSPPISVKLGDDVLLGDRITTGRQSLLRFLLPSKAVITIRELSILASEKDGKRVLMLDGGIIVYAVARDRVQPGEIHELRTPNAIVRVAGTVVVVGTYRGVVPRTTTICVLAGIVSVSAVSSATIQAAENQCVAVTGDEVGPVYPFPVSPPGFPDDVNTGSAWEPTPWGATQQAAWTTGGCSVSF
jgi:hypothetical protein